MYNKVSWKLLFQIGFQDPALHLNFHLLRRQGSRESERYQQYRKKILGRIYFFKEKIFYNLGSSNPLLARFVMHRQATDLFILTHYIM